MFRRLVLSIAVALVGFGCQASSDDPCISNPSLPTCPGAEMPEFELVDFQTDSPFLGETYGLERFEGKVTIVALWAAWCGYCRGQAAQMEALRTELAAAGKDINYVAINMITGLERQGELAEQCTFPLLQDTDEVMAWEAMNGGKDDMYVYGSDGTLATFLPAGSASKPTNLSTAEGYATVRDALLAAE